VAGVPIAASVSIGVACYPEDGRTLDALAARADRALYLAKQAGRNCVARYSVVAEAEVRTISRENAPVTDQRHSV
jgi:predicted signal transduction protein with EAL and GGDEF domain